MPFHFTINLFSLRMTFTPETMGIIGSIFFVGYFVFCIAVLVFVLMLLHRFVKAHEQISRHMYEIACDFKAVAEDLVNRNK